MDDNQQTQDPNMPAQDDTNTPAAPAAEPVPDAPVAENPDTGTPASEAPATENQGDNNTGTV